MENNNSSVNGETVSNFDLSQGVTSHCFKSSFARSMAFSNSSQSKSLDYVYFDGATIAEEATTDDSALKPRANNKDDAMSVNRRNSSPIKRSFFSKQSDSFLLERDYFKLNRTRSNSNEALRFWKAKKEAVKSAEERNKECGGGTVVQDEAVEDQLLRLRKECQSLVEENRRLQQSANASHLQTQIDTLQWQLKQAESSRQMYRAVMEQVSKFLERVHKNLENVQSMSSTSKNKIRSRSVHTVASPHSHSRASSPCPSVVIQSHGVHRANSIAQIQDSHYTLQRDSTWRVTRGVIDEVPPEKLSQEAFRLLRTVQSLLGTREPDLTHRLTPVNSICSDLPDSRDSTWCVGSCSSLLQTSCTGVRKSLDTSSCSSRATTQCTGDEGEVDCEGETSRGGNPSTPQLSVGSTEDESGFSSMSSFHEVGLPEVRTYPEVGLPIVEPAHRRWSSTPVENRNYSSNTSFCPPSESIRVLWV